eukprot:1642986-Pyramimonas_sp.AAC.1
MAEVKLGKLFDDKTSPAFLQNDTSSSSLQGGYHAVRRSCSGVQAYGSTFTVGLSKRSYTSPGERTFLAERKPLGGTPP